MHPARTSFSRRHLVALGTFLVPLSVLAVLGWLELQRSGSLAQASLQREARGFLTAAAQTIQQQFDLQVSPVLGASQQLLFEHGPVRTTLLLRDQEALTDVDDILLLDEQANVVWPTMAPAGITLPLLLPPQQEADGASRSSLDAADALLTHGRRAEAVVLLQQLVQTLEAANPPGSSRRPELEETEVHARFRLATAHRALGDGPLAREQFQRVQRLADGFARSYRLDAEMPAFSLLAAAALAEYGGQEERIHVLRAIAENRHVNVADGLATAVARRLAAGIPAEAPLRAEADSLLREEHQRAATRAFAATYELMLKYALRLRRQRGGAATSDPGDERIVTTVGDRTSLLGVRPATLEEQRQWQCTHVAHHFDLTALLAPALQAFGGRDGTFVLAIRDPDDHDVVPAPPVVPDSFTPPVTETHGLTLRAFPADPARLLAEAEAAARKRLVLLIALLLAAGGGALWLWRSVSRDAELASLKIDLVSRVSHELKTPLALIRMYGETLGMGRARDQTQAAEFGSIIARESDRLTTLIQRILDFSRQQAGTLQYAAAPIDLGELLRTVVDAYAPHLEARGAIVDDRLPPGITVECDANAAESAIVNLLENAAKYGPPAGEHDIELELSRRGEHAVVEVRDRGRGIPAAERERVFDGFYRASNAGEVRGAGLGLGLVRHFARSHGGEIEALARDGGGTIMRITLPLAPARSGSLPAAKTPAADSTTTTNPS
jgi:signal transduction histidine kinase